MSIRRIPLNVEHLPDKISLGRGSENEAVQLAVDVSAWVNAWPACSISINFLRPYEDIFYTVSGVLEGGLYTYEVTDTDTAIAGTGTMEFVCTEDGKLAASAVARFLVEERLLGTQSPTPPEPVQSWYTRALQAADDAEDAADRAETAAQSIESINPRVTALEHIVETTEQTAWNQLNANSAATSTASGVTFTNNGDGTWTLTGNGTAPERKQISAVSLTAGHVYAVLNGGIDTTGTGTYLCLTRNGSSLVSFYKDRLFTADIGYNQFSIRTTSGFVAPEGGFVYTPMLIDLTDIYGAGLEPTLAEFRQRYPHRIYPYAPIGSVRNLDITEVHGAQIAELQDDLDDANTAISANTAAIADLTKTMTKLVDVTLAETAAINITQDMDGNALNITDKLLMFVLLPKDSEVKQPAFLVVYKHQNAEVGRLYSGEVSVSILAGNKPGAFGMCENFGGIWRGYYSSSVANIDGASGSLVGYGTSQMYSVEGHPITSLSTTQELLAGTQIIVWGC